MIPIKRKTLIPVVLVLTVLLLTGFLIDCKGFGVNLIASAVSIIVTVTAINWLLIYQRRSQWKKVRSQTMVALLGHIWNMALEFMMHINPKGNWELTSFASEAGLDYSKPSPETARALRKMAEIMKNIREPDGSRKQAEELHKIIKYDIDLICSNLLPRIMAIETDEPELVSVLCGLDNSDREWVDQYIMDKEILSGDQYKAAAKFLDSMATIYQYIVDHPN